MAGVKAHRIYLTNRLDIKPKRVNFAGIQMSHTVSCEGYGPAAVRTGYEQVVAQRTSDLFAKAAEKPGKVKEVNESGIVVEYNDGEVKGYEIGRRFGKAAGLTIPHELVTEMKVGQKFDVGDILTYNKGYFEKDILNPNNVVWKAGIIAKTVLMELPGTLEDSSIISAKVGKLLATKITKEKNIIVSFDQSVHKLVKVGSKVTSEDILCIIEDAVTANTDIFDKESIETLRSLGAMVPQAKCIGVVERIEVYYRGDKEDMSDTLRAIANASDRELGKRSKETAKTVFTGSVDEEFRIENEQLSLDTAVIKIYITSDVDASLGDKGVFCNQMKTVFGGVFDKKVETESGQEIDAIFSYLSIQARIVNSPILIGTGTTLLDIIGKKAASLYFGN